MLRHPKIVYLIAALLVMTKTAAADIETHCAEIVVTAYYQSDISVGVVEVPFGYWKLKHHEIRIERAALLELLAARAHRIHQAGLHPHGSIYLKERIDALEESQWPVDMSTLTPPSSAWKDVSRPEPVSELYLASDLYRLSMQKAENSTVLEKVLFHGLGEIQTLGGQRIEYAKLYSFEKRLDDGWIAIGNVWVDPEGTRIHETCVNELIRD